MIHSKKIPGIQKVTLPLILLILFIMPGYGSFGFYQDQPRLVGVETEMEVNQPGYPKVEKIEIRPKTLRKKGKQNELADHVVFGDTIYVTVSQLPQLLAGSSNENPVLLYINGNRIEGILPLFEKKDSNPLIYILERNVLSNDAWNKIFRETDIFRKNINVTVGLSDGKLVAQSKKSIIFVLRETVVTGGTVAVVLALIVLSIYFVVAKGMLRDESKAAVRPYSLARTQLFFWTSIILLAYVFIWFVCDDMNSIDTTALVLLGISAGTTAASQIIDQREIARNTIRQQDKNSKGFWLDILDDGHGVSIHRYQNVLFTLVIGLFYIVTVLETYKMPQLSETVLLLMGISSATYASLKAVEAKPGTAKSELAETTIETASAASEDSAPAVG